MELIKIGKIKENPDNPRKISSAKMKKLIKSIEEFPEMLELRPMVVDENCMILGGSQRLKACKKIGKKEVPIERALNLTEEQKKEFIIKDNVSAGDWDFQELKKGWEVKKLADFGVIMPITEAKMIGSDEFSTELGSKKNYVVLAFDVDIDFLQIQSLLGLKSTYSKRENGKPWSKGIGRVVNGVDAIKKIRESHES